MDKIDYQNCLLVSGIIIGSSIAISSIIGGYYLAGSIFVFL